jgi:hypothetical protein
MEQNVHARHIPLLKLHVHGVGVKTMASRHPDWN